MGCHTARERAVPLPAAALGRRSVTGGDAGVEHGIAAVGLLRVTEKAPGVARRTQRQFENAEGGVELRLRVRQGWLELGEIHAAGADDELTDAVGVVAHGVRGLRSEPHIEVVVPGQQYLDAC